MNEQDRVLIRKGARELNAQEVEQVGGGFNTLAITFGPMAGTEMDCRVRFKR
jgi:hypothetical protein